MEDSVLPVKNKTMEIQQIYARFLESSGISTDSRKISKNSIFFALKGDTFDGNEFASDALKDGAAFAVVDNQKLPVDSRFIFVDDALKTLQELASFHRSRLTIPVIGLTGTNGKTTTKELISAVLAKKFRVCNTAGNFNNHIGVPLTLLGIKDDAEIAVIEMGASSPGEIALLTSIVKPDYGLITNVGKAHLLGFGSFEGVKKTKGELYDFLQKSGGTAFLNKDNEILCEMAKQREGLKTIDYGFKTEGYSAKPATSGNPFLTLKTPGKRVIKSHLIGNYNADNIIAALKIAYHFGISPEEAALAIESYIPSNNRSQLMKGVLNTLIVDAYNANPSSMKVSLENFANMNAAKKALIIGDMLELGEDSGKEHRLVLDYIERLNPEKIFFVGKEFGREAINNEYFRQKGKFFETSDELRDYLLEEPVKGYTILIKGSRGTRLERSIDAL